MNNMTKSIKSSMSEMFEVFQRSIDNKLNQFGEQLDNLKERIDILENSKTASGINESDIQPILQLIASNFVSIKKLVTQVLEAYRT